ncbi:hypothetical protein TcBrA4_0006490 [Trypanosoma cruzi]|nr:hypothetical protein TcBrA4_0006490 [Trypanosoma cruzi]
MRHAGAQFSTIAEMEVMASPFCMRLPFCARVYAITIFYQCSATTIVRNSPRDWLETSRPPSPSSVGLGERLRHTIEVTTVSESSSPQKRPLAASSRTHRSMVGEQFLFQTPAALKLPDENGRGSVFLSCRPRRARYAWLTAFSAVLPSAMDVWVDNTSLQGAANKGSSKSHAMTWELRRIYEFLALAEYQASFAYVRSAENPADGISRGRVFLHFRT